MRVLIYVPKIYEPSDNLFLSDKSGLAMFVHDIADAIKESNDVYVLTYKLCDGVSVNNINYCRHKISDWIRSITLAGIIDGIRVFLKLNADIKKRLKRFYFRIDADGFKRCLKEIKPDIVHINGCTYETFRQIEACNDMKIPVLVTLHGLIGIEDEVNVPKELKDNERKVFLESQKGLNVSVISTGIKNRASNYYKLNNDVNIQVILNGAKVPTDKLNGFKQQVCKKFGVDLSKKIIVCIGSINDKKNQIAIERAWRYLDSETREKYVVLFIGTDLLGGKLQTAIKQDGFENELKVCGYIDQYELIQYYYIADLNIVASVSEGFGLSIVEAMLCGVPTLTYEDLDAAMDLCNPKTIMLLKDRSDEALANGIRSATNKVWNSEYIKSMGMNFTMKQTGSNYIKCYERIIGNGSK